MADFTITWTSRDGTELGLEDDVRVVGDIRSLNDALVVLEELASERLESQLKLEAAALSLLAS